MREIKFRAWDVKDSKMIPIRTFSFTADRSVEAVEQRGFSSTGGFWTYPRAGTVVLMQYTGLKDKNGVEIFEGDILTREKVVLRKYYEVAWAKFAWTLNVYHEGKSGIKERFLLWDHPNRDALEVIGNIYETPDLISPAPDSNSDRGRGDEVVNEQAASAA